MKTIITPPDILIPANNSIFLIEPTAEMSAWFNNSIESLPDEIYTYIYPRWHYDIKWLLTTAKMSTLVVIDVDSISAPLIPWTSFIISLPQTKYYSKNVDWLMISPRRITDYKNIKLQEIYER